MGNAICASKEEDDERRETNFKCRRKTDKTDACMKMRYLRLLCMKRRVLGAWTKWEKTRTATPKGSSCMKTPHTVTQKMRMEGCNAGKSQKMSHMLQKEAVLGQRTPVVTTFLRTFHSCDVQRTAVPCELSVLTLALHKQTQRMRRTSMTLVYQWGVHESNYVRCNMSRLFKNTSTRYICHRLFLIPRSPLSLFRTSSLHAITSRKTV